MPLQLLKALLKAEWCTKACKFRATEKIKLHLLVSSVCFFIIGSLILAHQLLVVSSSTKTFSDIIQENRISPHEKFPFSFHFLCLIFSPWQRHSAVQLSFGISFSFIAYTGFTFQRPLDINSTSVLKTTQSCHSIAFCDAPEAMLSQRLFKSWCSHFKMS